MKLLSSILVLVVSTSLSLAQGYGPPFYHNRFNTTADGSGVDGSVLTNVPQSGIVGLTNQLNSKISNSGGKGTNNTFWAGTAKVIDVSTGQFNDTDGGLCLDTQLRDLNDETGSPVMAWSTNGVVFPANVEIADFSALVSALVPYSSGSTNQAVNVKYLRDYTGFIKTNIATHKGSVAVFDGTLWASTNGTDGQVLIADSSQATGVRFIANTPAAPGTNSSIPFNSSGNLIADVGLKYFANALILGDYGNSSNRSIVFQRGAATGLLGAAYYNGTNTIGTPVSYANIRAFADSGTATSEDGHLSFATTHLGTSAERLSISGTSLITPCELILTNAAGSVKYISATNDGNGALVFTNGGNDPTILKNVSLSSQGATLAYVMSDSAWESSGGLFAFGDITSSGGGINCDGDANVGGDVIAGNNVTANNAVNGATIGITGQGQISGLLTTNAVLDFGSTSAGASTVITTPLIGVTTNSVWDVVVTAQALVMASTTNGNFRAWISAADTISVRFTNPSLILAENPVGGEFYITATKH